MCDGTLLLKHAKHFQLVPESSCLRSVLEGKARAGGPARKAHSRVAFCELPQSHYLVSADNIWEAAKETFIFMVTFHQEMEIFLWL